MDLDIFNDNTLHDPTAIIKRDGDAEKYNAIAAKLCEKRRDIETKLQNSELTGPLREEYALSLIEIKKDLVLFGISEIEYQAYLAKTPTPEESASSQLQLF